MKRIGFVSTGVLLVLLGITTLPYARQQDKDKQQQERDKPQQNQNRQQQQRGQQAQQPQSPQQLPRQPQPQEQDRQQAPRQQQQQQDQVRRQQQQERGQQQQQQGQIRQQQDAVRALAGQAELRRLLTAKGLLAGDHPGDLHSLNSWLNAKPRIYGKTWLRILLALMTMVF